MKKLLISSIACLSMIAASVSAALPSAVDGFTSIVLEMAPSFDHSADALALDAYLIDEAAGEAVSIVQPIDGVGVPVDLMARSQFTLVPDFALSGGDGRPI